MKIEKNLNIDILTHFKIAIIKSVHTNISNMFYVNNYFLKKISDKGALFYTSVNLF